MGLSRVGSNPTDVGYKKKLFIIYNLLYIINIYEAYIYYSLYYNYINYLYYK